MTVRPKSGCAMDSGRPMAWTGLCRPTPPALRPATTASPWPAVRCDPCPAMASAALCWRKSAAPGSALGALSRPNCNCMPPVTNLTKHSIRGRVLPTGFCPPSHWIRAWCMSARLSGLVGASRKRWSRALFMRARRFGTKALCRFTTRAQPISICPPFTAKTPTWAMTAWWTTTP